MARSRSVFARRFRDGTHVVFFDGGRKLRYGRVLSSCTIPRIDGARSRVYTIVERGDKRGYPTEYHIAHNDVFLNMCEATAVRLMDKPRTLPTILPGVWAADE